MTALKKFARLEATALWRAGPDAQRREVVVSVGDATLVIKDMTDQALAHWSLAAVERANPGTLPAVFHPDGDPAETLEIPEDEDEMTQAIETLRREVLKRRPRPGRLRWVLMCLSIAAVVWLAVFWLPGAMRDHALRVVPQVKRDQIGAALLGRIERVSGKVCDTSDGRDALLRLGARLQAGRLIVLSDMTRDSLHLPGRLVLLNRALIEDFEEPDVAAGYVLTERVRARSRDPLGDVLQVTGIRENFRLLTTGDLSDAALDRYAEHIMAAAPVAPDLDAQLAVFEAAALRSTPYAYAVDMTGETTLDLIEGDPMSGKLTEPLLTDADWLRLQGICGS